MTRVTQSVPRPTPEPAWTAELAVEIRPGRLRPLVVVTGELEQTGGPLVSAVVEYVLRTDGGPVAVDLSQVPFADDRGLRSLLRADVVITSASPSVRRLLRLLGAPPPRGLPITAERPRGRARRARPVATGEVSPETPQAVLEGAPHGRRSPV